MPEGEGPDYGIAVVDRALDILQAMARMGPSPLAALAEAAGCTRTAAFRLLRTFEHRGLVVQSGSRGAWRLGAGWVAIGQAASRDGALAATAEPYLTGLAEAMEETVLLLAREGDMARVIAAGRAGAEPGGGDPTRKQWPLHAGGFRLLLAYAPPDVVQRVVASRLPRFTAATRIEPAWIRQDLPRIRERGWLIASGETEDGLISVTASVRDLLGAADLAISVVAPSFRIRPPKPRSLIPNLLAAAGALTLALSGHAR